MEETKRETLPLCSITVSHNVPKGTTIHHLAFYKVLSTADRPKCELLKMLEFCDCSQHLFGRRVDLEQGIELRANGISI
jgi:hypothetical protein